MYTSRYVKKTQLKGGRKEWKKYDYAKCPNASCGAIKVRTHKYTEPTSGICENCKTVIDKTWFSTFIIPRYGFIADNKVEEVSIQKPVKTLKTSVMYVGDIEKEDICTRLIEINAHKIEIRSTNNDSMMVINKSNFYICEECGYGMVNLKKTHTNEYGKTCHNKLEKNRLGHIFKTDVAQIMFHEIFIDGSKAWSVLYAMLEGFSKALEIERKDLDGCLNSFQTLSGKWNVSFILFDSVPGGVGHVRRLATCDEDMILCVFKKSLEIVEKCTCGDTEADTSCYSCLRNYRNQALHDKLQRRYAIDFLNRLIK